MKKSNCLSVRVLALLMTFVMLFSLSATVFAANSEVVSTEYYTISYNSDSDIPEIVVSVNAGAMASYLANGNFKKDDLNKFMPEFVAEILSTKTIPSVNELIELIPDEMLTKAELGKLVPSELLKKYLTADLITKILPKSEWTNVLPIKDVIDADEIAYIMENYPAVADAILTKAVIEKLVTADVIEAVVTPDVAEKLMTDELVDKLVTPDVLTTLMTSDVIKALTDKLDKQDLEAFMDDTLVDKLVTDDVIEALMTADVAGKLMTDSVVNSLITSNQSIMQTLLDDGIFTEDDFLNCLNDVQKTAVALAPNAQKNDVLFEQMASDADSRAKVGNLIKTKVIDVVGSITEELGIDGFFTLVGGKDLIIETIGMENIITEIGVDKIVAEVSAKQILDAVGADVVIAEVGMPAIIEAIGLENIIDEIAVSDIMNVVDFDALVAEIGMDAILDEVGMGNIINIVMANTDTAYITRIVNKVVASPNFDFTKVLKAVDTATLKEEIKGIFMKVLLNDVNSVDLLYFNGTECAAPVFVYNNSTYTLELDLEALSDALLLAVPNTDALVNIASGETFFMMGFGMNFVGDDNTYGCKVSVKFDGDVSGIAQYTDKLAQVLTYETTAEGIVVNVSDSSEDAFISFAELMRKVLAAESLTDAQKADIFGLFTKEGADFIDAFEAFDFNADFIDAKYVPYLEQIRDAMMRVLEQVMEASSVDYTTLTFASLYDEAISQFVLNDSYVIPTGDLVEMLCEKFGYSVNELKAIVGEYAESITYNLTLTVDMTDVYRVRYFDENGNLLYTTFLPSATDLSVINNNTSVLNGKAGEYGWADKDGEIVTVTPSADVDLYPANEIAVDTFIATFVADGKVVAKIPFKAGDTKLTNVPKVPEKTGYHGRWENYKLGAENITIKAIYTEKTYTVIYNANGGKGTMANQIITYDREAALTPCAFTRDGYVFTGWNTAADGRGTSYADEQVVKNMTVVEGVMLYAQWEAVAPTVHTVTFMANGTVVDKVTFNEGETELSRVPVVPARTGYVGAWEAYTLTNVDITVNAEYTANEYVVVFNANGGEGAMDNQTMTYDTFAELSANAYTYAGYVFAGWNTAADGTGTSYADGENVKNLAASGEVTLYAQWNAEVEDTTTATEETTTAAPDVVDDDEGGFNWIVLVSVVAGLAIAGGVAGFLVYKKKMSV